MSVPHNRISTSHRHNRRAERRGGVVLEVALVLPVLIGLAMGVGEYGYYLFAKNAFEEAAQGAILVAVDDNATDATVKAAVDTALAKKGLGSVGYTVTTNPASIATIATGTTTTVTITCPWNNFHVHLLPTSMGGIGSGKQVTGGATMVRE